MGFMDLRLAATRVPVDRAIDAFMASHYGLITIDDALRLGASHALTRERVHTGAWSVQHRGVFRDAAAPRSSEQDQLAAVMACGPLARVSHVAGAWAWGLLARPGDQPEISIPYARSVRHRGITIHRSTDLLGVMPHERRGMPVTDPARTILDACGVVTPAVGELLVDRGISSKLVTVAGLNGALERYGRRGRRGAGALRSILEKRGVAAAGR